MRIFSILAAIVISSCSFQSEVADVIIHNATIYSVDPGFSKFEAMAIRDGKIVELGAERQILNKYKANQVIDLQKKIVYPGFIDAHCHFLGYGLGLQEANLSGTKSWQEVVDRIQAHRKSYPAEWVIGRGWDQNDWETSTFPTRFMIDSVFPDTPVMLTRIDGHAAVINSRAMELAGISGLEKVDGGELVVENGVFTGVLVDNAIDLLREVRPNPDKTAKIRALKEAESRCFAVGLTTVDDAGLNKSDIELIDEMQKNGELSIRIYAMLSDTKENKDHYLKSGPCKTERLNVRSFKFYSDGSLGSRGACLIEPYADRPDGHAGFMLSPVAYFKKVAKEIAAAGFQMNTHCIGDKANREILHVYAEVLGGVNDRRWRIEHAQVVDPIDLPLFAENSIIPSVQPTHATSDMYWAEFRLGRNRLRRAYAWKELKAQLGMLALGTDFPVEGIDPLNTFYAAVFRKDREGFPQGGFQSENALTPEEALQGMTIWAAVSNFEEEEKGSLEPGKWADFVVLQRDLMSGNEEDVLENKVLSTWVNGVEVFKLN